MVFKFQVRAGRRFVKDEDFWVMHQRTAEQKAPFHAAGKFSKIAVFFIGQLEAGQKLPCFSQGLGLGHAKIPSLVDQKPFDAEERVKVEFLRAKANKTPRFSVIPDDIRAKNTNGAFLEIAKAGNRVNGRGLAGAIGPQKGDEVPFADGETHVIYRAKRPVIFCKTGDFDRIRHAVILNDAPSQNNGYVIINRMSKKEAKPIKAILFDLGNVIFYFSFKNTFSRLQEDCGLDSRSIERRFSASGLEVLYDGGKISSRKFFMETKKLLGLTMDYANFKKTWNDIFNANRPMMDLIRRLDGRHRLVLISNTNAMHFDYLMEMNKPLMKRFDRMILSFKKRIRKPDERIYRAAAAACQVKPDEIFYIDDRQEMTEAARDLGFHAFTYRRNHAELLRTMKGLGIL